MDTALQIAKYVSCSLVVIAGIYLVLWVMTMFSALDWEMDQMMSGGGGLGYGRPDEPDKDREEQVIYAICPNCETEMPEGPPCLNCTGDIFVH